MCLGDLKYSFLCRVYAAALNKRQNLSFLIRKFHLFPGDYQEEYNFIKIFLLYSVHCLSNLETKIRNLPFQMSPCSKQNFSSVLPNYI